MSDTFAYARRLPVEYALRIDAARSVVDPWLRVAGETELLADELDGEGVSAADTRKLRARATYLCNVADDALALVLT